MGVDYGPHSKRRDLRQIFKLNLINFHKKVQNMNQDPGSVILVVFYPLFSLKANQGKKNNVTLDN